MTSAHSPVGTFTRLAYLVSLYPGITLVLQGLYDLSRRPWNVATLNRTIPRFRSPAISTLGNRALLTRTYDLNMRWGQGPC
jgi:hypothetical protein